MPSRKITINDVAKKAGVSSATVSRYLNNPSSIKEKNRIKVEKAIRELNYKPSLYARKLAGGRLGVYGLIIPGYEGIFFSYYALQVIRGVGLALEKFNIDLHLHVYWDKDTFNPSLVDGIIFADVIGNEKQLKRMLNEGIPVVVINKHLEDIDVSYVAIDNFRGGYKATEFLIKHGHRYIAHIAGDLRVQCAKERLEGYKNALIKHNIKINPQYIKIANFSPLEAKRAIEELLNLSQPPTAVFVASDDMAIEIILFIQRKGIKVPEEISVIGFDDNPICTYGSVALTTIRQPLYEMTSLGVKILKNIIEGKKGDKIILTPELVVRDSVAFV